MSNINDLQKFCPRNFGTHIQHLLALPVFCPTSLVIFRFSYILKTLSYRGGKLSGELGRLCKRGFLDCDSLTSGLYKPEDSPFSCLPLAGSLHVVITELCPYHIKVRHLGAPELAVRDQQEGRIVALTNRGPPIRDGEYALTELSER